MRLHNSSLPLLAGLGLLALIVFPATRLVLGAQLRAVFVLSWPISERARIERGARRHPTDADAAMAAAIYQDPQSSDKNDEAEARDVEMQIEKLETLTARFPDHPGIYANILRLMTMRRVRIRRNDYQLLQRKPPRAIAPLTASERTDIAHYLHLTEVGEQLDSDNSFFPMMRVIGLLAAHRDAEALAALHRAAGLPHYHGYSAEPLRACLQLQEEDGSRSAFYQVGAIIPFLFPHYAQMREAVRDLTWLAVEQEKQGMRATGLTIRRDIMRFAVRMSEQDHPAIGTLVGLALIAIAGSHPGGAPTPPEETKLSSKARHDHDIARYVAYLNRQGWHDEAEWYRAEADRDYRIKRMIDQGIAHAPIDNLGVTLPIYWVACLLLLSNLLVVLACHLPYLTPPSIRAAATGAWRHLLQLPVTLWQWRVLTIFAVNCLLVITMYTDKPAPMINVDMYLLAVPFCFIANGIVAWIMWLKGRGRDHIVLHEDDRMRQRHRVVSMVAGMTCLAYVVLVWITAIREEKVRANVAASLQHEGRYFAELSGKKWPPPP
jgi:hypothetical protein